MTWYNFGAAECHGHNERMYEIYMFLPFIVTMGNTLLNNRKRIIAPANKQYYWGIDTRIYEKSEKWRVEVRYGPKVSDEDIRIVYEGNTSEPSSCTLENYVWEPVYATVYDAEGIDEDPNKDLPILRFGSYHWKLWADIVIIINGYDELVWIGNMINAFCPSAKKMVSTLPAKDEQQEADLRYIGGWERIVDGQKVGFNDMWLTDSLADLATRYSRNEQTN